MAAFHDTLNFYQRPQPTQPHRRKPAHERKVSILLYGFPPGVGATGTAALLNVPASLVTLLRALKVIHLVLLCLLPPVKCPRKEQPAI